MTRSSLAVAAAAGLNKAALRRGYTSMPLLIFVATRGNVDSMSRGRVFASLSHTREIYTTHPSPVPSNRLFPRIPDRPVASDRFPWRNAAAVREYFESRRAISKNGY